MSDWREGLNSALEQYAYMFEHGIHCDCTITVGPDEGDTEVIKAHKFVLIRASSVFEAMFLGGLGEGNGQVRVTDISPHTFRLLLRHIYTDNVELSCYDEAFELALAAEKYLLQPLKERCTQYLVTKVTPATVWHFLALSQLLQLDKLKDACVKVMQSETLSCLTAEDFESIPEESLLLLLEQDCLNLTSEIQLIDSTVKWARKEAERRGLSALDSAVREILIPRLLSKLRFLALEPEDFSKGPAIDDWLTGEEKSFIFVNLISPNKVNVIEHMCCNAKPRCSLYNVNNGNKIVKPTTGAFVCTRPLVSKSKDDPLFNSNTLRARMHIKADKDVWISGLKVYSQIKLKDNTLIGEHLKNFSIVSNTNNWYLENIQYSVYECGPPKYLSLSSNYRVLSFHQRQSLHEDFFWGEGFFCSGNFSSNVCYNSQITIFFPKTLYLKYGKDCYVDISFRKIGHYPRLSLSSYMRYHNVDLQCAFENEAENDGLIGAIIFHA